MADIFFSYDGQNYARYLTMFSIMLANIDETHPGAVDMLKQGAFSVARSFIPGSRADVDKTMEETFMKLSKSKGGASGSGITGITKNYNAYQRWVKTTHERSKFLSATLCLAGLSANDKRTHKDLRRKNLKVGYRLVEQTIDAIHSYVSPFSLPNDDKLYCLSSGSPAPSVVETDILRADMVGKDKRNMFITERLEKQTDFYEPIKRSKLKTFAFTNKTVSLNKSQNKEIQYKDQGNILTKLLVSSLNSDSVLDLNIIMSYSLTPVPYCFATPDGSIAKLISPRVLQTYQKMLRILVFKITRAA